MEGKCDIKEGNLTQEHRFPIVLGCKRGCESKEGDSMEVRVYF
jgi:hypothetical protein